MKNSKYTFLLFTLVLVIIVLVVPYFIFTTSYKNDNLSLTKPNDKQTKKVLKKPVYHINTPENVKAIYMTSWIASSEKLRQPLIDFIDQSSINSLVIDVKDYTGTVSIKLNNPKLVEMKVEDIRIKDIVEFIDYLHSKNIYVIARIAVFQDPYFVKMKPELAVKDLNGLVWKDRKGLSWIDPSSKEYWDYIVLLSKDIYDIGFDELNFDYIRFPSDGDMKNISYPFTLNEEKPVAIKNFFQYLDLNLRKQGIKISADLFGMTTTTKDDMGIGQLLENAIPYFDYIAPMIYPSHYPAGFEGLGNPAKYPYEVIKIAMEDGVLRANNASSTKAIFRPWIQDFDLGADYGVDEIKAQIKALSDLGINSYMVWSPSNVYTKEAY